MSTSQSTATATAAPPQGLEDDADLEGETGIDSPDDSEDDAIEPPKQALIHTYPVSTGAQNSKCGVCTRFNPSIDGTVLRKQLARPLDKDGNGVGKMVPSEVRVKTLTYKCGPERNPDCPAKEVRIVVGVNTDNLARRIHRAELQEDHPLMAELYSQLSLIDEDLRKHVTSALKTLRAQGESNDGSSS
jgi:hypothetical protein